MIFDMVSGKENFRTSEGPASLHKHDCRAVKQEKQQSRGTVNTIEADSLKEAIDIAFIESGLEEAGWAKSDIKVHNCLKRASLVDSIIKQADLKEKKLV